MLTKASSSSRSPTATVIRCSSPPITSIVCGPRLTGEGVTRVPSGVPGTTSTRCMRVPLGATGCTPLPPAKYRRQTTPTMRRAPLLRARRPLDASLGHWVLVSEKRSRCRLHDPLRSRRRSRSSEPPRFEVVRLVGSGRTRTCNQRIMSPFQAKSVTWQNVQKGLLTSHFTVYELSPVRTDSHQIAS